MVASLKFYTDSKKSTEANVNLSNAKVVVYEDGNGNKYTLDASSIANLNKIDDIKLSTLKDVVFKHHPNSGAETTTTGLGSIIGTLLSTQSAQNGKSVLAEEVTNKDVVKAIFDAKDGNHKISETKIGATFAKKTDLNNKADANGNNLNNDKVNAILDKLTDKVVKTSELSAKAVVDAITASPDFTNKVYIKADPADEVYTKTAADTALADKLNVNGSNATDPGVTAMLGKLKGDNVVVKVPDLITKVNVLGDNATEAGVNTMLGKLTGDNVVVKINASNLTGAANQQAFAEAILSAKDVNKSILVAKLEGFLAENAKAYSNNTKTAKELLVPSAADLVQDHNFKQGIEKSIKEMAVSSNSDFQKNVREVMSQPSFDIPPSDDAALNWTW